ncbi:hypothetical protein C8R44DRAFT_745241 [Mycena epipterygia]|nr:hypothetical protein C8R44DRAFT_745241 [Mycena epipterygia]
MSTLHSGLRYLIFTLIHSSYTATTALSQTERGSCRIDLRKKPTMWDAFSLPPVDQNGEGRMDRSEACHFHLSTAPRPSILPSPLLSSSHPARGVRADWDRPLHANMRTDPDNVRRVWKAYPGGEALYGLLTRGSGLRAHGDASVLGNAWSARGARAFFPTRECVGCMRSWGISYGDSYVRRVWELQRREESHLRERITAVCVLSHVARRRHRARNRRCASGAVRAVLCAPPESMREAASAWGFVELPNSCRPRAACLLI